MINDEQNEQYENMFIPNDTRIRSNWLTFAGKVKRKSR